MTFFKQVDQTNRPELGETHLCYRAKEFIKKGEKISQCGSNCDFLTHVLELNKIQSPNQLNRLRTKKEVLDLIAKYPEKEEIIRLNMWQYDDDQYDLAQNIMDLKKGEKCKCTCTLYNHSCDSNVVFEIEKLENSTKRTHVVYATKDIEPGTELTKEYQLNTIESDFDYNMVKKISFYFLL
jgi:SET domain-containing protein